MTDDQVSLAPTAVPNVATPSVATQSVATRSVATRNVVTRNVVTRNVVTPNVVTRSAVRNVVQNVARSAVQSVVRNVVQNGVETRNAPGARVVQELLYAVHCVGVAAHNAALVFLFAAAVPAGKELRFFLADRADVSRSDSEVR